MGAKRMEDSAAMHNQVAKNIAAHADSAAKTAHPLLVSTPVPLLFNHSSTITNGQPARTGS
jgi:hypothetical protein